MAQKTELSVLALPGPVHSFNAKEEAVPSTVFRLCGQVTNEPKYGGTVSGESKYSGTITNEPKFGGKVSSVGCD